MSSFNGLLLGSELLLLPMALLGYVLLAGDTVRRLIAAQALATIGAMEFGLLSIAFSNYNFVDLGITMALLGIGGSLLWAHFLERWL